VSTLIVFGARYNIHPNISSPSVPIAIFAFWASFASYHYPHFITLCKEGCTVINTTVGMMIYGGEILQGECQEENEVGSMKVGKEKPPLTRIADQEGNSKEILLSEAPSPLTD
jgi:hypothetical protein